MGTYQALDPQLYGYQVEVAAKDVYCRSKIGDLAKRCWCKGASDSDMIGGARGNNLVSFFMFQDLENAIYFAELTFRELVSASAAIKKVSASSGYPAEGTLSVGDKIVIE